jgi:hypothetical protein
MTRKKGEWMFLPAYGIMEKEADLNAKNVRHAKEKHNETAAGFIFPAGTARWRIVDDSVPARPV